MLQNKNNCWGITEKHLDTILDMVNDPVIIINKKGTIIYVNEGYELHNGVKREWMLGRNISEKYPRDKLLEVLRTGKTIKNKEHYNESLGYNIVASFLPIKDDDGQTIAAAGIGTVSPVYKLNIRLSPILSTDQDKPSAAIAKGSLPSAFQNIVGESPKLLSCLRLSAKIARTDATVMLRGETGVGKELFAQGIHDASKRREHPFIAVNCAAIPENLIESELFGYSPGAFTGARTSGKTGKIELANTGTLFLDEIGDLSQSTQVKILRFLQERYVERIGGTKQIPVDVRIITATNKNLEQMVQQGEFRADLYYRLNVVPIHIPPLRERPGDIELLSYHYLDYYCKKYDKKMGFSLEAMDYLQDYSWPGNVRELKNIIEHAVIVCSEAKISPGYLNFMLSDYTDITGASTLNLHQAVEYTEKKIIKKALREAFNNKSKAIRYLGISRGAFYNKIKKYNIGNE
ncbi:MAG: sigma 54-interacting transcriptional regulator [Firmicutes bacterium]|nr:sigma 54-interacting transcriptional regulator [Bacillota bacterium]